MHRRTLLQCLVAPVALAAEFEPWSPCLQHEVGAEKRALVTGVTGMLGSHVAEALLERGYEVYGVVRPRSNMRNVAAFKSRMRVVNGDLADPWRTLRMLEEVSPHFVFHFAAQAFNSLSFGEPQHTLDTNLRTTLNLLEGVRQLKLQSQTTMLLAGSSTVYGATTEDADGPISEDMQMQPVSPYGVSKAATELLGMQYARTHGVRVVIPRFFIHLAPRGVEALALHEFARQIAAIEQGLQEPVLLHGDISTERDITDIVDSAPVVICLAETAPSGTVVNIGSNTSYSIRDLLQEALSMSSARDVIRLELDRSRLRAYDERVVRADISKLRKLTGWEPRPNMRKLIGVLLDYWRREVAFRHGASGPAPSPSSESKKSEL